jgi:predicted transcriptional regulator
MGSITIRIDDALEADLARIAKAQGRSKSEVVREMLRRYTTSELFELARHELRPFAEAEGYLTDEDFFRDFS